MTGTIWIPGAERIEPSRPGGVITSKAPPRVVWHTTEADPGTSTIWAAMVRVLCDKSAEPQVLYDPLTDRLGQFMPLDVAGRALRNDGSTLTNRVGEVNIQIEVIGRAAKPFTTYWKPGKNFRALMAALRSHGIPDTWPAGAPPRFIASPPHNEPESPRSRAIWLNKGGHYSHSQIPGNDHGDPGAIDIKALFAAGGGGTKTEELFTVGQFEEIIEEQKRQGDATRLELKRQGDATRQEVRRQAIWTLRYGAQTEDERQRSDNAFDNAYNAHLEANPGDVDGALDAGQAATVQVMQPINADLDERARKNG